jgi:hypothetical protein
MKKARRRRAAALLLVCALPVTSLACGSCNKDARDGDAGGPLSSSSSSVVAELLPRCRAGTEKLAFAGDDVVVGDVAIGPSGLLVGLIRAEGGKRVASVMRASLDLGTSSVVDVGPALGDDPPPSPRWNGSAPWVAVIGPQAARSDAGPRLRALKVAELEEKGLARPFAPVLQQLDESTAFDIAWSESGAALAAWDEDAPAGAVTVKDASVAVASERGFVKVQVLAPPGSEGPARRIASPDTSDAESPRLIARGSGFWLAWLARRAEDDQHVVEGPGEKRAFRWVEVVALDAKGDPAGPVRRVSSERGRAATFELARSGSDLLVVVQDEAAPAEGAGARIVRYRVPDKADKEKLEATDIVDGGVGQTLVELVPVPAQVPAPRASGSSTSSKNDVLAARWLAWSDTAERAQMTPLGPGLAAAGRTSPEPALDGARVLAQAPPDTVYALVGADGLDKPNAASAAAARARPELRRFVCR